MFNKKKKVEDTSKEINKDLEENNQETKETPNKVVIMTEDEKKERKIMKKVALVCALVAVVGGAFYGGLSYGRVLPASHRYYSNSEVYASVGDSKITGKDLKSVTLDEMNKLWEDSKKYD